MIYTIRCRRGHCGSQYQYDFGTLGLEMAAMEIEKRAESRGWYRDDAGWLCPFDAPQPAAEKPIPKMLSKATPSEDYTRCSFQDCCNANLCTSNERLTRDGWHTKEIGQHGQQWLCPACWKTTQPEPTPEWEKGVLANAEAIEEGLEREAADRLQEMRKVARLD